MTPLIQVGEMPNRLRKAVMELSTAELSDLIENDKLPAQMHTGFDVLDRKNKETGVTAARIVVAERKNQIAAREEADRARAAKMASAAEAKRIADEAEKERKASAALEAARKAEEEIEVRGLVLLRKTVAGSRDKFGGEITGIVVNRRRRKVDYAQISFNLYDDNGNQVGTALANITNLKPGGRWKFTARGFGKEFATYKFAELTGF